MRLGILGGTFDPIHFGHLLLAETCREQLRLTQVWFLPTAVPPHKQRNRVTTGQQRCEMIELAVGGHDALRVCRYELERGGVNYTADTLSHFHQQDPTRELFFLMGADSLRDLSNWKDPGRICNLAVPVVVGRGLEPIAKQEVARLSVGPLAGLAERLETVSMPAVELSSSEIRARVAAAKSIRYRTPRAVEAYIESHGLYQD